MISAENLVRIYKTAEFEVIALQGLDLEVADGELMAIIGNSGSGKSTLLNVIGGLDLPSAGKITVADRDLLKLSRLELLRYRREKVGFVWAEQRAQPDSLPVGGAERGSADAAHRPPRSPHSGGATAGHGGHGAPRP